MRKYVIFKHPYLLIEDVRKRYKPFYKEYTEKTPRFTLGGPALGCPFIQNKTIKFSKMGSNRPGVCEICHRDYESYESHVNSSEHREFALDYRNYQEVDEIISSIKGTIVTERCDLSQINTEKFVLDDPYGICENAGKFVDEYLRK